MGMSLWYGEQTATCDHAHCTALVIMTAAGRSRVCSLSHAKMGLFAARRHGDKAAEMQLVDFRTYVEAAEKLVNENPLGLKRVALVTSEDPWVIEEASHLGALDIGALATTSQAPGYVTSILADCY